MTRRCTTRTATCACAHWLTGRADVSDPSEFVETLKVDLFEDDVLVFTPKGEVKSLAAGGHAHWIAYDATDVGHRCVGAKVNGKIVPLSYQLRSGDIVEVLTWARTRSVRPSLVKTTRARNKIKAWYKAESRGARTLSTPVVNSFRTISASRACLRRRSSARR